MYSLLIIDDESIVRAGIRTIIRNQGTKFDVIYECCNGLEALAFLETTRPDLIITDIRMPGMDGLVFIEKCAAMYPEKPPEIIVLSGHRDFEYARKAMRYGVKNYLLKPINRRELISVVDAYEKVLSQEKSAANKCPRINDGAVRRLCESLHGQIQYMAVRILTDEYRNEPEQLRLFKEGVHACFGGKSDTSVIVQEESASTYIMLGSLRQEVEEMSAFLDNKGIERYAIGLWNAEKNENTWQEGIAKAKQAMKIAILNPCSNLFVYRQGGDYTDNGSLLSALQYMHDHYDKDIGMVQVANHVSLNYNYFSSMFKAQLGVNFMTCMTRLRVDKAKFLLRNGNGKINEIANMVGYSDPKRFSRAFYRCCGMTPLEYRRRLYTLPGLRG